jgi:ferredoxin
MGVKIDTLKCTGCGACTYVCPAGVLLVEDMKCRVSEGCISCGACVDACAFQAITLEDKQNKIRESKRGEATIALKSFPLRRRRRGHMGRGRR